jgi:hypothetical protein
MALNLLRNPQAMVEGLHYWAWEVPYAGMQQALH